MEAKTEGMARLRLKDIITLSIFNIAMSVIMVIVKMIMTIAATPALDYHFYVSVMLGYEKRWYPRIRKQVI